MKRYNINNYVIYHKDLEQSMPESKMWDEYTRDELIIKFMPLVENLARKFATSHQAIGILSINDLIQAGHIGLITAIDKLEWDVLNNSHNIEQTLKSFLSKRIKGTIRRYINANMGDIKVPEWKINEIRKKPDNPIVSNLLSKSKSMYLGDLTANSDDSDAYEIEIADESKGYNLDLINSYLIALLEKHLICRSPIRKTILLHQIHVLLNVFQVMQSNSYLLNLSYNLWIHRQSLFRMRHCHRY